MNYILLYQPILTKDVEMRCATPRFILQLLTQRQEESHLSLTSGLPGSAETDENSIKNIITDDET
jgi:hypothetical protein